MFDLERLHWGEFEKLAGFYLKEYVGVGVVRFDGTRDQGRDATFSGTANAFPSENNPYSGAWIFQAKHRTTKSKTVDEVETELLRTLPDELEKIFVKHRHECDNYIYIVNIDVGNSFRDEAKDIFDQFCKTQELSRDINFGVIEYKDFESFLTDKPHIRYRFPALLEFTDIQRIFLNKEAHKTIGHLNFIRDEMDKFVATTHFHLAMDKIYEHDVLMIVGNPKSGKSYLSDAIALCVLEEEIYTPYFIKNTDEFFNISANLDDNTRALFICDDIFGKHDLDRQKLADWRDYFTSVIGTVRDSHKFLFTTRLYIFEQFKRKSGLSSLFLGDDNPERLVIRLNELSKDEREQILEKHMLASDLSNEIQRQVLNQRDEILESKDFSPEVIRSLVSLVQGVNSENIPQVVTKHIENPNEYLHEFFNEIELQKRLLLLSLTVSRNEDAGEVERTFNRVLNDVSLSPTILFQSFIQELDGSIVKRRSYLKADELEYYHPSMFDVMIAIFKGDSYYRSLMLKNLNLELMSLLTLRSPTNEKESQKVSLEVSDADPLKEGLYRLVKDSDQVFETIRAIKYVNTLNTDVVHKFQFLSKINMMKDLLREKIGSREFFEKHSNDGIVQWIELFDRWSLVGGNAFEYLAELAEKYSDQLQTYDYWRLVFLLEHIEDGFIETNIDEMLVQKFQMSLDSKIATLANNARDVQRRDGKMKPNTDEWWLPLFRELDDLVTKIKKSEYGQRLLSPMTELWSYIKLRSDFAKNRHRGMVKEGHWKKKYKHLRNYEIIIQ